MDKTFITWDEFSKHCDILGCQVSAVYNRVDIIIALARGGVVPARLMAETVDTTCNPGFYSMGLSLYNGCERKEDISIYQDLPECNNTDIEKILIIDDISDGGTTLEFACSQLVERFPDAELITATPYIKKSTKFIPDFYVKEFPDDKWIVFPFEKD